MAGESGSRPTRCRSPTSSTATSWCSAFRDITQRKEADERMRTLSAIVETSTDAIFRQTLDGIIDSWNAGAEQVYGFTAAEVIGAHHATIVPDDHLIEAEQLPRRGRRDTRSTTCSPYGDARTARGSTWSSPLLPSSTRPARSIGVSDIAGDVTELIETRDALAQSEERFRSLVQRSSDVAFVFDADGVILYASPAASTIRLRP